MKSDKLQYAIGMVDEDLIERANKIPKKKARIRHIRWTAPVAAALAIVIGLGAFFSMRGNYSSAIPERFIVAQAHYPKMAKYPTSIGGFVYSEDDYDKWREDVRKQEGYSGQGENLDGFFQSTASEFLKECETDNKVYSPLNVYMALSMLCETTKGKSRQQILDLLGADDIESLRTQSHAVWNANYRDDGAVTSILGSSLWLDKDLEYNKEVLNTLSDNYYASVFSGRMGSKDYNKAYGKWLDEQTGGLLKDYTKDAALSPETLMNLVTTIYFQAKWGGEFEKQSNTAETFHSTSGDTLCEFMNQQMSYGDYYWGEKFSATKKDLQESGSMYFILPNEGYTPQDLLSDKETTTFLTEADNWNQQTRLRVNLSIPKFDVSSNTNLVSGLKNLGVTDCFDMKSADFSPLLSGTTDAYIDSVSHKARVTIDEEGVTAAAYTELRLNGSARPPEDEIDFVVDRPFIFVITGTDSLPLFIGVVNNP